MAKSKKKEKKKSKNKKKERRSSSSSNSYSTESGSEELMWKEADCASSTSPSQPIVKERESWMTGVSCDVLDHQIFLGSLSSGRVKTQKIANDKLSSEQLARTSLELNPFWKDGGSGLPQTSLASDNKEGQAASRTVAGDSGLSWLRRSLQLCREESRREGRSLEEVAAERHGSLSKLYSMINDAENKCSGEENLAKKRRFIQPEDSHNTYTGERQRHANFIRENLRSSRSPEQRWRKSSHLDEKREDREKEHMRSSRSPMQRWRKSSHLDEKREDREKDHMRSSRSPMQRWRKFSHLDEKREDREKEHIRSSRSPVQRWRKSSHLDEKREDCEKEHMLNDERDEDKIKPSHFDAPKECDNNTTFSEMVVEEKLVTDKDINEAASKLLRAELGSASADKLTKLRNHLTVLRDAQKRGLKVRLKRKVAPKTSLASQTVLLTRTARSGHQESLIIDRKRAEVALEAKAAADNSTTSSQVDLLKLVRLERRTTAFDTEMDVATMLHRAADVDDEYTNVFSGKAIKPAKESKQLARAEVRERQFAIKNHKRRNQVMQRCRFCLSNIARYLIIHRGQHVIMCLPSHVSMMDGHCVISSIEHLNSMSVADDDVFAEVNDLQRQLSKGLAEEGKDCVFVEIAQRFEESAPHAHIECFPMLLDDVQEVRGYFRKALSETGSEWASNKKLIPLHSSGDIRRSVPAGFPYLCVRFGASGSGLVHVIENEISFPLHFAREIIAGMLDLDPSLWRHQKTDDLGHSSDKATSFKEFWQSKCCPTDDAT